MRKARVLIVDDSTVIRRLLTDALSSDPSVEVSGTAANGRIALTKVVQSSPDVVTLDMEMPEMDGLATLAELRKTHPRLPVIMFSTLTQRGAVATLNALALGASDYVTKPANVGGVTAAIQAVKSELLPKIKALCRLNVPETSPADRVRTPTPSRSRSDLRLQRFEAVAIGVSTGGPNALTEIFRQIAAPLPVPIVIVQHMPPVFTQHLAERLNAVSGMEVVEAKAGERLQPGKTFLAPGNFHMAVTQTKAGPTLELHQGPPENSCRPAADVLFRSVAQVFGSRALALVLTGMGQDGLRGCEAIAAAGGRVIAQDEATSVVWGMPGAVVRAGLADLTLPLAHVVPTLMNLNYTRLSPLPAPITTLAHA